MSQNNTIVEIMVLFYPTKYFLNDNVFTPTYVNVEIGNANFSVIFILLRPVVIVQCVPTWVVGYK